jgi:hypothetical protein
VKVIEIIGNQYLRILALEETLGQREVEISLLKEKVMKLTPAALPSCPLVGCKFVGPHDHVNSMPVLPNSLEQPGQHEQPSTDTGHEI